MSLDKKSLEQLTKENPNLIGSELLKMFNDQSKAIAKAKEKVIEGLEAQIKIMLGDSECLCVKGSDGGGSRWVWKFTNFDVEAWYSEPYITADVEEVYFDDVDYNKEDDDENETTNIQIIHRNIDKITLGNYSPLSYTTITEKEFDDQVEKITELREAFALWVNKK